MIPWHLLDPSLLAFLCGLVLPAFLMVLVHQDFLDFQLTRLILWLLPNHVYQVFRDFPVLRVCQGHRGHQLLHLLQNFLNDQLDPSAPMYPFLLCFLRALAAH